MKNYPCAASKLSRIMCAHSLLRFILWLTAKEAFIQVRGRNHPMSLPLFIHTHNQRTAY